MHSTLNTCNCKYINMCRYISYNILHRRKSIFHLAKLRLLHDREPACYVCF